MNKTLAALVVVALAAGGVQAQRPAKGFLGMGEADFHDPSLLDLIATQNLLQFGDDVFFERESARWASIGCELQGLSDPLDLIVCPGFRSDPKIDGGGWSELAHDYYFGKPKPIKVKKAKVVAPTLGGV